MKSLLATALLFLACSAARADQASVPGSFVDTRRPPIAAHYLRTAWRLAQFFPLWP